ncbi:MAG: MBL fold metallo-hydrolase [Bacteroidales bacterium]|nr:MBL fold metallo-hydrolase [Bacteroidales bacterium]
MIHIKLFEFNVLRAHCVILWDDGLRAVVVDPGYHSPQEKDQFHSFISNSGLKVEKILLTHAHIDHVTGLKDCCDTYALPVTYHKDDLFQMEEENLVTAKFIGFPDPQTKNIPSEYICDGDMISVGEISLEVLHTPGHSPGSVCYLCRSEKLLLSGDTLFAGCIGRTDFRGGDYDSIMNSIRTKLMTLDGDIDVIPGHGGMTSIAAERQTNPFLEPFNLPLEDEEN